MVDKQIEVGVGIDADYVFESITQDITIVECLFDLIDNAVDAVRVRLTDDADAETDVLGLPASYCGAEIHLDLSADGLVVSDNGCGVSQQELEDGVLMLGRRTIGFGLIGKFGIGLKRALLKLGETYSMSTLVEGAPFDAVFRRRDLAPSARNPVVARETPKTWNLTTQVRITDLTQASRNELFVADDAEDDLRRELGFRYGLLIRKGLSLELNNESVLDQLPKTRGADSPIPPSRQMVPVQIPGITALAETGTHLDYRFRVEGKSKILSAEEYGWYISFNDRVVRWADRSRALGFPSAWHGEYNGFIGWLQMSGDTDLLPWNSKKTDIDENSDLLLGLKGDLTRISTMYRTANRAFRKQSPGTAARPGAATGTWTPSEGAVGDRRGKPNSSGARPVPTAAAIPPFLDGVEVSEFSERIQQLVDESRRLDPSIDTNLCTVTLRVLVDLCTADFYDKMNRRRGADRELKLRVQGVLGKIDPDTKSEKDPGLEKIRYDLKNGGLLDTSTLHGFVHRLHHRPTTDDVRVLAEGWGYYIDRINAYLRAQRESSETDGV